MAYETGTLSTVIDLIDKFRLFAIGQGWTVNRWITVGSGRELCIKKGAQFYNFRAYLDETAFVNGLSNASKYGISLNGSDGYDSGTVWDRQPGYPARDDALATNQGHCWFPVVLSTGPFPAYHFFAPDSKTLYAEIEIATSTFIRFGCGALDLFNPAASGGGRFCYATTGDASVTNSTSQYTWLGSDADQPSYSCEMVPFRSSDMGQVGRFALGSMVRVGFSSFDNWAASNRAIASSSLKMCCQGGGVHDKVLREYSPNPLNGIAILNPNIVSLNISGLYLSPIGVVPGMRYMDMTNYLPGDEFSLGSDTWKVFPWYQKGGIGHNRGIAYLKV